MLRKDAQSNSAHRKAQQREQPSFCEDSDSDEEECPLPGLIQMCVAFPRTRGWLNGTEEEKRAILRRKMLELVKSKKDARLLWFKYVDRKKKQRNGKTDIYKIHLVALGYGQGKDEEQQTFAPVVKGTTIRILFALPSCPICLLIDRTSFCSADLSGS